MANGNNQSTVDCGEPLEASGAQIAVPTVTGPVSNTTPLIISTMGDEPTEKTGDTSPVGEVGSETAVSFGGDCPWPLVLLALVLAFVLSRGGGA